MDYKIEILKKQDIILYKNLIDECFGHSNDLEKYKSYCENNSYRIFVIKYGDIIVGSVTQYAVDLFTFDFQPCLMLFNVAVSENYRNRKIAVHLLEYVIEQAKSDGYKSISLTCLDTAYVAHRLYESVGFEKASSIKYNLDLR